MIEKLNKAITEKSEKIMANEKVEGFVNNLGGVICFFGAVVFGIMFIIGGASLMKTGKNYVVKPSAEEAEEATSESTETEEPAAEEAEEATSESAETEEPAATESTATEESPTTETSKE